MSPLQALTTEEKRRDPAQFEKELKKAVSFIILCLEIARRQVRRGRHFLFEQSRGSTAWGLNEMVDFEGARALRGRGGGVPLQQVRLGLWEAVR